MLAERGRLASEEALRLVRRIVEGVDCAHRRDVLHLDLKPGNVLIDSDGEPRIADFGLARRIDQAGNLVDKRIAGTPSYMAPEQTQVGSGPLTPATDVWGMGAILYELLCGQPPFEAADAGETVLLLQTGVVRRLSRLTRLSRDLEAICLKCLAKSASDRYPTARALADDLDCYVEGRPASVRRLGAIQ